MKPLLSDRARSARLENITSLASGAVLDIGCGHTQLPDQLPNIKAYTGIDFSEKAIVYCRRQYPQHKFHCLNLDIESMPSFDRQFDTVIMTAVIEHLHHPARVLQKVRPLLVEDGHLLVTTPSPLGDVAHQIGSRIKLFYPESVVQHVKIFGKNELCALLIDNGFEIELYRRFLLGLNQFIICHPAA